MNKLNDWAVIQLLNKEYLFLIGNEDLFFYLVIIYI